jgi:hypothetical protein
LVDPEFSGVDLVNSVDLLIWFIWWIPKFRSEQIGNSEREVDLVDFFSLKKIMQFWEYGL